MGSVPSVVEMQRPTLDLMDHPDLRKLDARLDAVARGLVQEYVIVQPETVEPETSSWLDRESYQESLIPHRAVGACALRGCLETPEGERAVERLRRDFWTSLVEIFENEKDFRGAFEVNDIYEYAVQDEKVMSLDGRPMVELIEDGARKSREAVANDPLMETQANRDAADIPNARRNDEIASGRTPSNSRMVVSRHLGEAIERNPDYWRKKGYREGLSFIQLFYFDGSKMRAGTFSIVDVKDDTFRSVMAEHNWLIPENESGDAWVKHGLEQKFESWEEAEAFAKAFRRRCYEKQGDTRQRQSVNDFLDAHRFRIERTIQAVHVPLSESIVAGTKNPAVHDHVSGLLQNPRGLKADTIKRLEQIAATDTFDDESGRFLIGFVLYGLAENLYKSLQAFADQTKPAQQWKQVGVLSHSLTNGQIIQQLVHGTLIGAQAGRKHGGPCPGVVDISAGFEKELATLLNPQEAYGGNRGKKVESSDRSSWETKKGTCIVTNCPTRPGRVEVGPCEICMDRCQKIYDEGGDPTKGLSSVEIITLPYEPKSNTKKS